MRIIVEEIIKRTIAFLLKDGHCGTASLNISTRIFNRNGYFMVKGIKDKIDDMDILEIKKKSVSYSPKL